MLLKYASIIFNNNKKNRVGFLIPLYSASTPMQRYAEMRLTRLLTKSSVSTLV
jgi:hypothetical protein